MQKVKDGCKAMGKYAGGLAKLYKGSALEQQKELEQRAYEALAGAYEKEVETEQQQIAKDDSRHRLREAEKDLAAARLNLGALKRVLSTLVFQLRILDLDAIEDKETRTIPLKVPVKVIRELLAELDKEEGGDGTDMMWPTDPVYPDIYSSTTKTTAGDITYLAVTSTSDTKGV